MQKNLAFFLCHLKQLQNIGWKYVGIQTSWQNLLDERIRFPFVTHTRVVSVRTFVNTLQSRHDPQGQGPLLNNNYRYGLRTLGIYPPKGMVFSFIDLQ